MPFLKLIEIVGRDGKKTQIGDNIYDPKKHTLWSEKDKVAGKPVDLDFEPKPEDLETDEDEESSEESKENYRRKRK